MKRVNNIYENICDIYKIQKMCNLIASKTKNKDKIENFELYKSEHIINIYNRLKNKDFRFSRYNIFLITDPKCRVVMAQNIEDKVINHLVAEEFLVKVFDNSYTESMCATRIGKGTKYSINLLKKYINKIRKSNSDFYYLKLDIKKYFYSIDHKILKNILRKKIKDKDVLKCLDNIIDTTNYNYVNSEIFNLKRRRIEFLVRNKYNYNFVREVEEVPYYEKSKGCSIGNQTSQAFGLIYLNGLNHYIKENLKIKYIVNYMDDFIIIHHDKYYLKYCLNEIEKYLNNNLKLEVNKRKTKINNIKNGIQFLGYRFIIKNDRLILKIGNRSKKNFKKRVKELKYLLDLKEIDYKYTYKYLSSYKGLFEYGNCNNFYKKNIRLLNEV